MLPTATTDISDGTTGTAVHQGRHDHRRKRERIAADMGQRRSAVGSALAFTGRGGGERTFVFPFSFSSGGGDGCDGEVIAVMAVVVWVGRQ
ncbi:pollen-specific leucine-rich repeat extensin-like protein 4 [Iris pallida]|uniref:Pollen-specific leucine-rich repeat extensin-like protein 4 n=1 Tax=Iris pallida TaxID=29817 RepID=A0AAX6GK89_IRIPA|nr:pollen-specific leucine-rich repeat extensin-like protein 4 [Iris pallida]